MAGLLKLAVVFAFYGVFRRFSVSVPVANEGRIESCDSTKFNFTAKWTPKILSIGTTYQSSLTAVTAASFASGTVCGKVWMQDIPDPIFDDCDTVSCDEVATFAKKQIPNLQLSCPIPKGALVHVPNHQFYIDPVTPLPGGVFTARIELKNEKNEDVACIQSIIEINDDFDENF